MNKNNVIDINEAKTIADTHLEVKAVKKRKVYIPTRDNPRDELKHLVLQHKALVKTATSLQNQSTDKKNHATGEKIECRLPLDVQSVLQAMKKEVFKPAAAKLESQMLKQLKQIPIYNHFLKNVFGVGAVVAAYLVSEIDIHRAVKPSAIRRFCGLAVIDGRLERRKKGVVSSFSSEMRTRIYQAFMAMWKNGVGKGYTSKYLKIWTDAKHRKMLMSVNGKISNGEREVSARGYAHSYGWHKAADIFLEDLYTVWRALEGLDVWPSYYAAKLGYEHGGKICVNAPKKLTVEEALVMVEAEMPIGGTPYVWSESERTGVDVETEEDEETIDAAAEE